MFELVFPGTQEDRLKAKETGKNEGEDAKVFFLLLVNFWA
jgi:hypothetical protein